MELKIAIIDAEVRRFWRGLTECYAVDIEEKSKKKEPDLGSLMKTTGNKIVTT